MEKCTQNIYEKCVLSQNGDSKGLEEKYLLKISKRIFLMGEFSWTKCFRLFKTVPKGF